MDIAEEYLHNIAKKYPQRVISSFTETPVQKAYENKTLFITGGNGFIGKPLIYILFRTCNIKKVYLLLRPKKGKLIQERLDALINDSIFDSIKETQPDFASKLTALEGNASELSLGLGNDDWKVLTEEVEIIFHGAATVNFEEHIKLATLTNVRGTREIIRLARECHKLRALVHISTAYSQATRDRADKEVKEEFYSNPIRPSTLIELAETTDGQILDEMIKPLRRNWPNTYTFTKAIAESLFEDAKDLPISIVKPAVVINAYREPHPGWLDPSTVFGCSGLVYGSGMGVLHVVHANDDARIDMVPVDYVVNGSVAAGYAAMEGRGTIYTMATTSHSAKWSEKFEYLYSKLAVDYITPKAVWYSFTISTERRWLYVLLCWWFHDMPAYILDFLLFCAGRPTMFAKLARKASKLCDVLSYFTTNNWIFTDKNLSELYNGLTADDKDIFYFDISTVNWEEQMFLWGIGTRKYCMRDGLKNTAYGIKKQFWLKILHYSFTTAYLYFIWIILKNFTYLLGNIFVMFIRY